MNRAGKSLIVLLVAAVGLWGCSQASNPSAAQAERVKSLETRCGKLEDDYKAAAAARDAARKQVAALEDDKARLEGREAQLRKEIEADKAVAKERDELRQVVDARTGERDQLQTRCERLKKGLQNLLGQDDAAATPAVPSGPVLTGAGGL